MRLFAVTVVVMVAILCEEFGVLATMRGRSEDLGRALGELRRRRRWLESGSPLDFEPGQHQYGTVTHFPTTEMRKRQMRFGPELLKTGMPLPPIEEDRRKKAVVKKVPMKRSLFRERDHKLQEDDRRRKRFMLAKRESDADYDDTWQDSEAELKSMAQQRFLDALLRNQQDSREINEIPNRGFEESNELLDNLDEEDVLKLINLLRRQLAEEGAKYYMEGEGAERSAEDDEDADDELEDRRKRLLLRKRLMWQDGLRYSLGDQPPSKRQMYADDEDSAEERPWVNVDPRVLAETEELDESGELDRRRKKEQDPWFPAFELPERKRYYHTMLPMVNNDLWQRQRKRGTSFRERLSSKPDMSAFMGTARKRVVPVRKRNPEEMLEERKRIVKKSVPAIESQSQKDVMNELKSMMADDKSDEHKRRERRSSTEEDEEDGDDEKASPELVLPMDMEEESTIPQNAEDEESPISDYFGYDRRDLISRKRKRSWDDYIGIDKRREAPVHHLEPEDHHIKPLKEESAEESSNTTESSVAVGPFAKVSSEKEEVVVLTTTNVPPVSSAGGNEQHRFSEAALRQYFKTIAAAMSSKKKRTPSRAEMEEEAEEAKLNTEASEESAERSLSSMDHRLETIENLMLEEALGLVENNKDANGEEREELKERVVHRLDAAQSLEKMREALMDFDNSLGKIREDQETPFGFGNRKKKVMAKKQSMAEALHVMAPQNDKRTSDDSDDQDVKECGIYSEIVLLCQELSKTAGDSRGALVDACSRHIMCYACDYAYEDGPRVPCDLVFMREGHDICGDDLYCRSAAAQMHGILRQRAKVTQRASAAMCLSESCVHAYRRR